MRAKLKIIFEILGILTIIGEMILLFIPDSKIPTFILPILAGVFEISAKLVEMQLPKSNRVPGTYKMAPVRKHVPFPSLVVALVMVSLAFTIVDVLIGTSVAVLSFIAMFIVYNIYQKKGFNDEISPLQRFFIFFAVIALLIVEYLKLSFAVIESQRTAAFIFFGLLIVVMLIATIIILIVLRNKNAPMKFLLTFVTNSLGIFLTYILGGIGNFGIIDLTIPFALPAVAAPIIALVFNAIFYLLARIPINIMEKTSANEFVTEYNNRKPDDRYHNTYVK